MKPKSNVPTQPYSGGGTIKSSPINDHRSGNPTTKRGK